MVAQRAPTRDRISALQRAGYQAQQAGLAVASSLFMSVFHAMMRPSEALVPPSSQRRIARQRFKRLLRQDLANVEAGHYPRRLLFENPLRAYLKTVPEGLMDIPRVLSRARRGGFDELPAEAHPERYPSYYRRTFHWQTDGWFSEHSATLYDPGVELLFVGTADIMRRMLIPDLRAAVGDTPSPRVIDVACGTGRFLRQLHAALPDARLYGLDLSPHYARFARDKTLADVADVTILVDNAETIGAADAFFDAASCHYLFHELPRDVRRNVMREVLRILKPGGIFAICASPQYVDSADIKQLLDRFPRFYHEPYYKGYLRDPLEDALAECGFEVSGSRDAFMSKLVIARKPHEH